MSRLVVIPLMCAAILGPAMAPVPAQEPAASASDSGGARLVGMKRIPQARFHRPEMGGERRRRDGARAAPVGLRQGRRDEGLLGGRAPG